MYFRIVTWLGQEGLGLEGFKRGSGGHITWQVVPVHEISCFQSMIVFGKQEKSTCLFGRRMLVRRVGRRRRVFRLGAKDLFCLCFWWLWLHDAIIVSTFYLCIIQTVGVVGYFVRILFLLLYIHLCCIILLSGQCWCLVFLIHLTPQWILFHAWNLPNICRSCSSASILQTCPVSSVWHPWHPHMGDWYFCRSSLHPLTGLLASKSFSRIS